MTSLADELSAASCGEPQECQDVSNRLLQHEDPENNPNIANTSRTSTTSKASSSLYRDPTKYELNNEQCSLAADTSYDMDITCDVTMPAMVNPQLIVNSGSTINNTVSATDSFMDETMAVIAKQQERVGDSTRFDLSTIKTEDEKHQSSLDISLDDSENVTGADEVQLKEHLMSSQLTCQWSQISTDFDPDEETANFGTRHALEADGKLFDVFTYATIEPKVIF